MAIFLKRKRSPEDVSDSSRASSSFSSDSSYGASTIPQTWALVPDNDVCMTGTTHQIDNWSMSFSQVKEISPPHLDSRTRKRFRDSRPDESAIYETTYQKLYSAQRSPAAPSPSPAPTTTPYHHRASPPQTSLHNFWSLPHRPTAPSHPPPHLQHSPPQPPTCEDCDAPLLPPPAYTSPSTADVHMLDSDAPPLPPLEIDEQEFACRACARQVCEMCAVLEVGRGRECLQCTTSRKRWLGGIGWMSPSRL